MAAVPEASSSRCVLWFGQPLPNERSALAAAGWYVRSIQPDPGMAIGLRGPARAMDRTAPASALAGGAAARRRRHTGGMVARAAALPCAVHPAIRPAGPGLRDAQPVRGG
ncbi:hypothetical protein G6F35_016793 [Rhizopus arrhizus]|nr:hypothetical protein G6F35_016793 [Rhizopus arrhizus]KAG1386935.1 hypothetical protein G6F60_014306 [Rhizopus arrhizus]